MQYICTVHYTKSEVYNRVHVYSTIKFALQCSTLKVYSIKHYTCTLEYNKVYTILLHHITATAPGSREVHHDADSTAVRTSGSPYCWTSNWYSRWSSRWQRYSSILNIANLRSTKVKFIFIVCFSMTSLKNR